MENITKKLTNIEKKILKFIFKNKDQFFNQKFTFDKLKDLLEKEEPNNKNVEIELHRGIQWLKNKNLLDYSYDNFVFFELTEKGEEILNEGLPEFKILKEINKKNITIEELSKNYERNLINISLGSLRKEGYIIFHGKELEITDKGKEKLNDIYEENFLKQIINNYEIIKRESEQITNKNYEKHLISSKIKYKEKEFEELKKQISEFIKRNLIKITEKNNIIIDLQKNIEKINKEDLDKNYEEILSQQMIKEKTWKNKEFRHYDVMSDVPEICGGKKHIVNQVLNYMKKTLTNTGFTEMKGNNIQTAFWDLDSLFVPQDHPARAMQDTFYLNTKGMKIKEKELYEKIKKIHLNGEGTNSKGWNIKVDEKESEKLMLRTHTTCLSAQKLYELGKKGIYEGKFFSIDKNYRNETLDWKHLYEFYQVEGIVLGKDFSLTSLRSYIKKIYEKLGFKKIRIRPSYFPYTEPSLEISVYHEGRKEWVELGGAGIIRSEVVIPLLGKDVPVLAWGLGLERIIINFYGLNDLRDLYKNDLKLLKKTKVFLK